MPATLRVVIWHNPRCSKSRGTLELLRGRGIEPVIVDYQKGPAFASRDRTCAAVAPPRAARADAQE